MSQLSDITRQLPMYQRRVEYVIQRAMSRQTQNICITFIQCWTNVEDVGPTLYKCYTNVLRSLGCICKHVGIQVLAVMVFGQRQKICECSSTQTTYHPLPQKDD